MNYVVSDNSNMKFNQEIKSREVCYASIQHLIYLFQKIKEKKLLQPSVEGVIETLLVSLDYLSQEEFIGANFTKQDEAKLHFIFEELFSDYKRHDFFTDTNKLCFFIINCEETELLKEFERIVSLLGKMKLKPNPYQMSYSDYLKGMTDLGLHLDLIFYLNRVISALVWFLQSESWRDNTLRMFDEMDLASILRISWQ